MKEMEDWIKRELKPLGSDHIFTKYKESTWGDTYSIDRAALSECVFTIRQIEKFDPAPNNQTLSATIPMKEVNLRALVPREGAVGDSGTKSKATYFVTLAALASSGDPFTLETTGYQGGATKKPGRAYRVRLLDQPSADRVAEVLRRAALLCGAPDAPSSTVAAPAPATSAIPAAVPPAAGTAKMTNDQVIQLVAAGLSDAVITISIRQAPARAFDLTTEGLIALKKAGVSDALILVMQERGALTLPAATIAPTEAAAAAPKYDASLGSPVPAAGATLQNGCSGIENMGVYKNEIFDRAMGGGVVEWLAKIRNNTAVTKIVVIGWRDMYGAQRQTQVQIRAGEIASPRLDLTQARPIPPIANIHWYLVNRPCPEFAALDRKRRTGKHCHGTVLAHRQRERAMSVRKKVDECLSESFMGSNPRTGDRSK